MCGIFGCIISEGDVAPIIHSALKRLEIAFETNNENELQISLNKLSKYFKICGIFLLVLLIIIIIGIIAAIAVPAFLPANEALVGT